MYNGLVINDNDSVLMAIAPVKAGEEIIYRHNGKKCTLVAITDVPIYHKAALTDIKKDEPIIKYGYKIGYAMKNIAAGEHVHTWNLDSMRRK